MDERIIRRDELYEQVWTAPVREVAKQYGISDVALAKICRKLNVPVPGRGYWANRAAGGILPKKPLPRLKEGQEVEHHLRPRRRRTPKPELEGEAGALLRREQDGGMREVVPAQLTEPHPLIRKSAPFLRKKNSNIKYVLLGHACLHIRASAGDVLERALRVADTLIKALERRGFRVEVTKPIRPEGKAFPSSVEIRRSKTGVHILAQFVEFAIRECVNTRKTPREPIRQGLVSHELPARCDRYPNGNLALVIRNDWEDRRTWKDGKVRRVENCLNKFIVGLIHAAESQRLETIERERRHQEWEADWRRQQEAALRLQHEERLVRDLNERTTAWQQAQAIRAFVAAVEQSAKSRSLDMSSASKIGGWIAWARQRADRLENEALATIPCVGGDSPTCSQ